MKKFQIQGQDFVLALFVLSITAMLVIPLPTSMLDFLLVINISFSLLLLLAGLYMPNALALISFPSLLLLTTLFRLGLNVASMGSEGCLWMFWDEEECPKSLIK